MTYEEAISRIKKISDSSRDVSSVGMYEQRPIVTALDMAKEALKKQIPKKVLPDNQYLEGMCPFCGVHFLDRSTNFCGNCGQAVDFSK